MTTKTLNRKYSSSKRVHGLESMLSAFPRPAQSMGRVGVAVLVVVGLFQSTLSWSHSESGSDPEGRLEAREAAMRSEGEASLPEYRAQRGEPCSAQLGIGHGDSSSVASEGEMGIHGGRSGGSYFGF